MKLCNYNFANSIFHQSYHLTVFVTFVLWHFCNGQINFVKFLRSSPPYPCNIVWWVNNTGYTMFSSTIIPLCNVWMLWIYVNDLLETLRNTPLVIVLLKKLFIVSFFLKKYIYILLSKSGWLNALKLEFASSSFFALMLDPSQHQQPSLCQTGLQGWLIKNNMCWELHRSNKS